ncbi:alcohol dehydrogenase [Lacticaseibacillus baoqingensis]|uniref:Alcohol dehydrogenase n=1 Tax=Lacticaseibacillus baoqingensis TaxID=2486013 RepID=A0ABW4E4L9_9LACO|nr:alcohol dehydrogenase [Lacticaseibacillus baoqingensis]
MSARIDLTGQHFARLQVLHAQGRGKNGNVLWLCRCRCGNIVLVDGYRLRTGETKSCGCLRKEASRQRIFAQPQTVLMMQAPTKVAIRRDLPQRRSRRNRSGVTGVSWDAQSQRWLARLMVAGKLVLNHGYVRFADAKKARQDAERQYGVAPRR